MIPEIVKRAMVKTVVDIGQLTPAEKQQLNQAVKRGWLSRGKGGPFPMLKTVYAVPTFDHEASRRRYVDEAMRIAELEARLRANGYFDPQSPNYGKSFDGQEEEMR